MWLKFGSLGKGDGELGIALDAEDKLYVSELSNYCISVFTSEGSLTPHGPARVMLLELQR